MKHAFTTALILLSNVAIQAKEPPRHDGPLEVPFDVNRTVLPKDFEGNQCRQLALKLGKYNAVKSEFETTEQFQSRLDTMKTANLTKAIRMDSYVGFTTDIGASKVSYDADAGTLKIEYASPSISNSEDRDTTAGFIADLRKVSERTYRASNAFGSAVTVTQRVYDACVVGFVNFVRRDAYGAGKTIVREMSSDEARTAKNNLAALYIGQLAEPYSSKYAHYSAPSVNVPFEGAATGRMVLMTVDQTWIYNKKTGVVYEKF